MESWCSACSCWLRRRRSIDFRRNRQLQHQRQIRCLCYSALTPYPGTLTWYEMKKANRIVSFDWSMYDQGHVVYRPAQMSADELRIGLGGAYGKFYSTSSIASRFPLFGKRHRAQWLIYNLFMRKASQTVNFNSIAAPTVEPDVAPMPPILPVKREWREAVLEAARRPGPQLS